MSDVICRVCGEPWETWGAGSGEGDLSPKEYRTLLAGEGCPSCGGQATCVCGHAGCRHWQVDSDRPIQTGSGRCHGDHQADHCDCGGYRPRPETYDEEHYSSIEGEDAEAWERLC